MLLTITFVILLLLMIEKVFHGSASVNHICDGDVMIPILLVLHSIYLDGGVGIHDHGSQRGVANFTVFACLLDHPLTGLLWKVYCGLGYCCCCGSSLIGLLMLRASPMYMYPLCQG